MPTIDRPTTQSTIAAIAVMLSSHAVAASGDNETIAANRGEMEVTESGATTKYPLLQSYGVNQANPVTLGSGGTSAALQFNGRSFLGDPNNLPPQGASDLSQGFFYNQFDFTPSGTIAQNGTTIVSFDVDFGAIYNSDFVQGNADKTCACIWAVYLISADGNSYGGGSNGNCAADPYYQDAISSCSDCSALALNPLVNDDDLDTDVVKWGGTDCDKGNSFEIDLMEANLFGFSTTLHNGYDAYKRRDTSGTIYKIGVGATPICPFGADCSGGEVFGNDPAKDVGCFAKGVDKYGPSDQYDINSTKPFRVTATFGFDANDEFASYKVDLQQLSAIGSDPVTGTRVVVCDVRSTDAPPYYSQVIQGKWGTCRTGDVVVATGFDASGQIVGPGKDWYNSCSTKQAGGYSWGPIATPGSAGSGYGGPVSLPSGDVYIPCTSYDAEGYGIGQAPSWSEFGAALKQANFVMSFPGNTGGGGQFLDGREAGPPAGQQWETAVTDRSSSFCYQDPEQPYLSTPFEMGNIVFAGGELSEEPCTGDLNDDGVVDGGDISVMFGQWGSCSGCAGDLDESGDIGGGDIGVLLSLWGDC